MSFVIKAKGITNKIHLRMRSRQTFIKMISVHKKPSTNGIYRDKEKEGSEYKDCAVPITEPIQISMICNCISLLIYEYLSRVLSQLRSFVASFIQEALL